MCECMNVNEKTNKKEMARNMKRMRFDKKDMVRRRQKVKEGEGGREGERERGRGRGECAKPNKIII
jgi:hypothetical protein